MDPNEEKILNKIKSGQVKMRPRFFFVLRGILIILSVILLVAVCAFLVSFLVYLARPSADSVADMRVFLSLFPWILIGIAILLTIGLVFILKRYSFAYRKPLIFLPIGIIAVIAIVAFVAQEMSFHERFERYSTRRNVPGFGSFYGERERYDARHHNMVIPYQNQYPQPVMPMSPQ